MNRHNMALSHKIDWEFIENSLDGIAFNIAEIEIPTRLEEEPIYNYNQSVYVDNLITDEVGKPKFTCERAFHKVSHHLIHLTHEKNVKMIISDDHETVMLSRCPFIIEVNLESETFLLLSFDMS